jgi:hypothetical protein
MIGESSSVPGPISLILARLRKGDAEASWWLKAVKKE